MSTTKKGKTSRSIWNLIALVPRVLSLFRGIIQKVKIETYFTIKNILILFMIGLTLACLLTATWISLLAILFFGLLKLQWSWYSAAIVVMSINLICLILLGIFMSKIKTRIVKLLSVSPSQI